MQASMVGQVGQYYNVDWTLTYEILHAASLASSSPTHQLQTGSPHLQEENNLYFNLDR